MTTYTDLFTSYILNGTRQALQQVQQGRGSVDEASRNQAWHLLTYALRVESAWPRVRELLLALAPSMEMAGYRDEWIPFLQTGVEQSNLHQDWLIEARLSLSLGQLLRLENRYAEAETWLVRAMQTFQKQNNPPGIGAVHNQLGRIRYLQHRDEEARQHAATALSLLAEDDPERAESYFVLGMAALNQRQWEAAESNHLLALGIRQRAGNQRTIAWAMQNLGTVLVQQSEYGGVDRLAEAADWLEQAVAILDSLPDPFHCAVARNSLSIAYSRRGQLEKATRLLCQAESAFQAAHSPEWLARVCNNLGLVYLQSGRPEDAETSFRAGVALYTELADHTDRLNTQHGIVLAMLAQEHYADAAELCKKGLSELDVLQDIPAQYTEKESWYRASLAKAQTALGL